MRKWAKKSWANKDNQESEVSCQNMKFPINSSGLWNWVVTWISDEKLFHGVFHGFSNLPQRCLGKYSRRTGVFCTHSTIFDSLPWSFALNHLSNTDYEEGERIPNSSSHSGKRCGEGIVHRLWHGFPAGPCRPWGDLDPCDLDVPAWCDTK